MDLLNLMFVYTLVVSLCYVAYGVAVSVEAAVASVTGHTYASLAAEVAINAHNLAVKAGVAFEGIFAHEGSRRYFG